jgi:hypothetical protein
VGADLNIEIVYSRTMATSAEALFKFRRSRREGKSFKIKWVALKKKTATRATCSPDMERMGF